MSVCAPACDRVSSRVDRGRPSLVAAAAYLGVLDGGAGPGLGQNLDHLHVAKPHGVQEGGITVVVLRNDKRRGLGDREEEKTERKREHERRREFE